MKIKGLSIRAAILLSLGFWAIDAAAQDTEAFLVDAEGFECLVQHYNDYRRSARHDQVFVNFEYCPTAATRADVAQWQGTQATLIPDRQARSAEAQEIDVVGMTTARLTCIVYAADRIRATAQDGRVSLFPPECDD